MPGCKRSFMELLIGRLAHFFPADTTATEAPRSARGSQAGDFGCVPARELNREETTTFNSIFPLSVSSPPSHSSQYPVDPRLVPRTLRLEPVHHFRIDTQRNSQLARTVPARLRPRRLIRQQQQFVFHGRL